MSFDTNTTSTGVNATLEYLDIPTCLQDPYSFNIMVAAIDVIIYALPISFGLSLQTRADSKAASFLQRAVVSINLAAIIISLVGLKFGSKDTRFEVSLTFASFIVLFAMGYFFTYSGRFFVVAFSLFLSVALFAFRGSVLPWMARTMGREEVSDLAANVITFAFAAFLLSLLYLSNQFVLVESIASVLVYSLGMTLGWTYLWHLYEQMIRNDEYSRLTQVCCSEKRGCPIWIDSMTLTIYGAFVMWKFLWIFVHYTKRPAGVVVAGSLASESVPLLAVTNTKITP